MRISILLFSLVLLSAINCFSSEGEISIRIYDLRTEMLKNPEGIDALNPRLSWKIGGESRGLHQTAYRILVASSAEKLADDTADLWDSGKQNSSRTNGIKYQGKDLQSSQDVYWKVKVWTNNQENPWSATSHWSMGLLHFKDWKGRWIGMDSLTPSDRDEKFSKLSARYFRKTYRLPKQIKSAKAHIIGLGLYELYINGKKIGDQVLAPAPTDYSKNILYNTFDVTDALRSGDNTIGTILGNGRYYTMRQNYKPYKIKDFGYPKMLLNVLVEYTDGSSEVLRTDNSWKMTADGPIRSNNEYDGEIYDARKEMPGWTTPKFDDSNWINAQYVLQPSGNIEAQMTEYMKVEETISPISISPLKPDTYILDMGQNMVGWIQLKVSGSKGDQVKLRFAEILNKDGSLNVDNLRDAQATDVYTLKGDEEETWEPSFIYHGFRYVEISGFPGTPTVDNFKGRVVNDALEVTGTFETSNSIINQVYKNAFWGIRGNYKGMPVDCPQRNERQPWLGDRPTSAYGESFIFDNQKLYSKWLDDIRYTQKSDGALADVAPAFWMYYSDNMTWPGTYLMIADMIYRQFGTVTPIKAHYPHMKKWLEYMKDRYMDEEYILTKDSYGDWVAPPATIEEGKGMTGNVKHPSKLISTAYHYYYLQLMSKFAALTENQHDVTGYQELAEKVKKAFNKHFFNKDKNSYGKTLTDNILAYQFDLVPEPEKEAVFNSIVHQITKENNGHLNTGVIGTQWIMRCLTENGRADLAYTLATGTSYPSWGYMVENGATTIWELWNGNTAAPNMNSYNHVMLLGDLIVWYYENLAGIKSKKPGFKEIEMKPIMVDELNYVNASYNSIYGPIISRWKKNNKKFTWEISIPPNTSADIYVPAKDLKYIKENGQPIAKVDGIELKEVKGNRVHLKLESGNYKLSSKL